MTNLIGIDTVMNKYVIVLGNLTFPYFSPMDHIELSEWLANKFSEPDAFTLQMDGIKGPMLIIKPAPGSICILMTQEQFERNKFLANVGGRGHA